MEKHKIINSFLSDSYERLLEMDYIKDFEDDIINESIKFAYNNKTSKIIVEGETIKKFIINSLLKTDDKKYDKDILNSIIYTKQEIKQKPTEGLKYIITLFISREETTNIINETSAIYYRIFLQKNKNKFDVYSIFKEAKKTKEIIKEPLNKEDFKEAIRIAMNEKNSNLLEIKVKDMKSTPQIFYKGDEVDYEDFVGASYAFEFGDEEFEGTHKINLAFNKDGSIEALQHGM